MPKRFDKKPAESLSGPRVYSTDFHPSRFADPVASEELEALILRSLKVKFLTKGTVTINGAHLLNPPVQAILKKHPSILSDGLLLPALREDKVGGFGDYLGDHAAHMAALRWTSRDETLAVGFIEETVSAVLPWRLEQAKDQYRARLLDGLRNQKSKVNRELNALGDLPPDFINQVIKEIEALDFSQSRALGDYISRQPAPAAAILRRFAHACYHVVGTNVVNCETGMDLSALSEFRIGDLTDDAASVNGSPFSDVNIFIRFCFGAAMRAINEITVPTLIIDAIPFDRFSRLRTALAQQGFQEKYDQIVSEFVTQLTAADSVKALEAWNPATAVELARQLAEHFRGYIVSELPDYRKAVQDAYEREAIEAGADTIKNLGGAVPGIGEIISVYETAKSTGAFAKAGSKSLLTRDPQIANTEARRIRDTKVEELLERLAPSNRATILSALRELRAIAAMEVAPN